MAPAFQPADSLRSRTFVGLLVAQFLAAFNDQAIHASAMFFAINRGALNEAQAISLMPILFYAPWALFCTLAGYLADRYSKYSSLVAWKFAEVGITLIAVLGFWLGTLGFAVGPWIVLSTVFLMGTHSAFFVPAKYGAMPEILTARMLSRGNGLLESLSFLAVILGTVCGGILSDERVFGNGRQYYIGLVLAGLAVLGAAASLLIRRMPAANPTRPFPPYVFGPLPGNVRGLLGSRPLAFATVGIAFFTFVVAYMRATVYMFGESQVPRWSETRTSELVGLVALGIGLGSPLVGYLSGGKVELGLVPIGAAGMTIATVVAGVYLGTTPALIVCIICIGFFTGFYIVPLFTLLQHRAPKTSKGDFIATSNLINVTGAILASLVFYLIDFTATRARLVPTREQEDRLVGALAEDPEYKGGRPHRIVIDPDDSGVRRTIEGSQEEPEPDPEREHRRRVIDADEDDLIDAFKDRVKAGDRVIVSVYEVRDRQTVERHVRVRRDGQPPRPAYDKSKLPRGLFLGASALTLLTLVILRLQLPDLFLRTRLWFRWLGRARIEVASMEHCPGDGAAVLAMSCRDSDECLQVLSASERTTRLLVLQGPDEPELTGLARYLAVRRGLGVVSGAGLWGAGPSSGNGEGVRLPAGLTRSLDGPEAVPAATPADWPVICAATKAALARGEVVALPVRFGPAADLLDDLIAAGPAPPVVPLLCLTLEQDDGRKVVYIVAGAPLGPGTRASAVLAALRDLAGTVRARLIAGEPLAGAAGH
jgi:MFS family permease